MLVNFLQKDAKEATLLYLKREVALHQGLDIHVLYK